MTWNNAPSVTSMCFAIYTKKIRHISTWINIFKKKNYASPASCSRFFFLSSRVAGVEELPKSKQLRVFLSSPSQVSLLQTGSIPTAHPSPPTFDRNFRSALKAKLWAYTNIIYWGVTLYSELVCECGFITQSSSSVHKSI